MLLFALIYAGLMDNRQNLTQLVIKGGAYIFLLKLLERLFTFARLIILARLLAPKDFGLMGIALLTLNTVDTLSQTGFQQALIQKKNNIAEYLNPAWTLLLIRGVFLAIIIFFVAPVAATFFKAPDSTLLIQIIAIVFISQGLMNIGVVFFQKELEFNKQFILQLSGVIVDFVVAVTVAIITRSVWALALGLIAGHFIRAIASFLLHPYRPGLDFNLGRAAELFSFGKWVLGSSILLFFVTQGDAILVGKLLSVVALGFYQMAYHISNTPATEITHIVSQVTFPAYARLQDNLSRLRSAYLKVLSFVAVLVFPLAGGIILLSQEFTLLILGAKWSPIIKLMQVLGIAGLLRAIAATTSPVFLAVGKPQIDTFWQTVRLIVMLLLFIPFIKLWDLTGAALAVTGSILATTIGLCWLLIRITRCPLREFFIPLLLPLIGSLIMGAAIWLTKVYLAPIGLVKFLFLILEGIVIYGIVVFLQQKIFHYNIFSLLIEKLKYYKNRTLNA